MHFSIVTLSFNQCRYLACAISSVLNQRDADFEYWVVDPGSTDESRDIILAHSNRLRYIFEPDSGPSDGLNKGFAEASGEIFYYLNSDDIVLPNALQKVANYFELNPEADVIYGNGYEIDDCGRVIKRLFSSDWDLRAYAFGGVSVIQQATFIRSKAFRRIGGFNSMNRTCWDGELLVKLALSGSKFMRVDDFFGVFRLYPNSISGSGKFNKDYESDQERVRELILGRSKRKSDAISFYYFRILKIVRHPKITACKVIDQLNILNLKFRKLFFLV